MSIANLRSCMCVNNTETQRASLEQTLRRAFANARGTDEQIPAALHHGADRTHNSTSVLPRSMLMRLLNQTSHGSKFLHSLEGTLSQQIMETLKILTR